MQARLKKKFAQKVQSNVSNLLRELDVLNNTPNWNVNILTRIDEIVCDLKGVPKFDLEGSIGKLARYDYALLSGAVSSSNGMREYSEKIENLKKLHKASINNHQKKEDGGVLLDYAAKNKSYIFWKSLHDALDIEYEFSQEVIDIILTYKLNPEDAEKLARFNNLNITPAMWDSTVAKRPGELEVKIPLMMKVVFGLCFQHTEHDIGLLDFFIRKGMPLNAKHVEKNVINLIFAYQHLVPKQGVNKELLEAVLQRGADVNARLTTNSTDDYASVFSVAAGSWDLEAIKLVLHYGANPYLSLPESIDITGSFNTKSLYVSDLQVVRPNASKTQIDQYIDNIRALIEQTLLERMLGRAPKPVYIKQESIIETHASSDDSWGDIGGLVSKSSESNKALKKKKLKAPKFNQKKDNNLKSSESTEKDDGDLLDDRKISGQDIATSVNETASIVNEPVESANVLSQDQVDAKLAYIQHAAIMENDSNVSEEVKLTYRFDSLLLQGNAEGLQALLDGNPELHAYSVTTLLRYNVSDNLAHDVLAYNPELLHKFCRLKKQSNENKNVSHHSNDSKTFAEGVFEVASAFGNKVFIKIPDQVMHELKLDGNSKLGKLGFVSPNSTSQNGIKVYNNGIKLKLGRTDKAAYTTKQYIDKNGDILIIFNKIFNHKSWSKVGGALETIDVTNSQLDSEVYEGYACNNESNSVGASPFYYSSDSASDEDNDYVDVMGDI